MIRGLNSNHCCIFLLELVGIWITLIFVINELVFLSEYLERYNLQTRKPTRFTGK